jgi:shikimate dehydrogenase
VIKKDVPIIAAVLGADVSKSRSPAIHEAAFRALKISGRYIAQSIEPEGEKFTALVQQLRANGLRYVNVTIPHKIRAATLADSRGAEVRVSGAANTLIFQNRNRIRAENTDGYGLLAALDDLHFDPKGQTIVVVGAGGAAAGGIIALCRAGARIWILPRRITAGEALRKRLSLAQRKRVKVRPWNENLEGVLQAATALVSAVPAHAWADDERRVGLRALSKDTVVLEMAYGAPTPLAEAVGRRTRHYADGLGMLVHQAARAVELALGEKPRLAPLFRAARQAP